MKVSPVLHFASAVTINSFLTLVLLAAILFYDHSSKIAEAVILYPSLGISL